MIKKVLQVIAAEPGWLPINEYTEKEGTTYEVSAPVVAWVFGVNENGDLEVDGWRPPMAVAGGHGLLGIETKDEAPIYFWPKGMPYSALLEDVRLDFNNFRLTWNPENAWIDPDRFADFQEYDALEKDSGVIT